jgi:putative transposase
MFLDDLDRTWFCNRLARIVREHRWICRAFCLMSTHYHLVLDVPANSLPRGMQRLNGPYAQRFNKLHGRSGHLKGDRYYAGAVTTDAHMLLVLRYLARNPVESGLCDEPSEWRWGSYRGCVGADAGFGFVDSSWLQGYFGADVERACELLRAFVDDFGATS